MRSSYSRSTIGALCAVSFAALAGSAVPLLPPKGEVASFRKVKAVFLVQGDSLRELRPPVSLAKGDRLLVPTRLLRDNRFKIDGKSVSLSILLRGGGILSRQELSEGISRLRSTEPRQVAWLLDAAAPCRVSVAALKKRKRPMYWELAEREALRAIDQDEPFTNDPDDASLLAAHAKLLAAFASSMDADRQRLRLLRKIQYLYDIELLERPSGFRRFSIKSDSSTVTIEGPAHLRLRFEAPPERIELDGKPLPIAPLPLSSWVRIPPGSHQVTWSAAPLQAEIWIRNRKPSLAFRTRRSIPGLLDAYASLPPGDAAFVEKLDAIKREILANPGSRTAPDQPPYAAQTPEDAAGTPAAWRIDAVAPRFASSWLLGPGNSYRLRPDAAYKLSIFSKEPTLVSLRLDGRAIDLAKAPGLRTGTLPAGTGSISFDAASGKAKILLAPKPEETGATPSPAALRSYRIVPQGATIVYLLPDDGLAHDLRLQAHDAAEIAVTPEGGKTIPLRFSRLADRLLEALGKPRRASEQRSYLVLPPGRRRLAISNDGAAPVLLRLGRRPFHEAPGDIEDAEEPEAPETPEDATP